jgi:hypothetical protein
MVPAAGAAPRRRTAERAVGAPGEPAGGDWEERCYRAGCAFARELAQLLLAALEAWLHLARPAGYAVEGWRARTLVTRMGEVRVRRRLYRAPDGGAHFLLDAHLGWTPRQVATPSVLALLVDWATEVPFAAAARKLAQATAGALALSGPTVRRRLQQVVARVRAAELETHQTWAATGRVPEPAGERVVAPLYVEADGVHVKTQRDPAHPDGYELKCASAYEGWERCGGPTPGHPRPHYALVAKQVYCHLHARETLPFWEGASLALHRTDDLSRLPLVVVGGDGANWIDGAADVFPRVVRQRDGFHLARDAARGWGTEAGAQLYAAVRRADPVLVPRLLALPAPNPKALPAPRTQVALPPAAAAAAAAPAAPPETTAPAARAADVAEAPALAQVADMAEAAALAEAAPVGQAPRRARWSRQQVARARRAVRAQVATADAGAGWRTQVAPDEVPPEARGLGTQEGTNAHLLARRMKRRGCSWSVPGAQAMGKARELVTNGTLAPWCLAPRPTPPPAACAGRAPRRPRLAGLPGGRLPWPQVGVPAAHGPPRDASVARLQQVLQSGHLLR